MHKLQCLNIAKGYLQGVVGNSMQYLADQHFWRNKFQDQLQVVYRDWLYKKIQDEFLKEQKSDTF